MRSFTSILLLAASAFTSVQAMPVAQQGAVATTPETWAPFLAAHNEKRAIHQAGPSNWNATLARYADAYAKKCTFSPESDRKGYGQNLYSFSGYPLKTGLVNSVGSWYNGAEKYDYNKPGFTSATGTFTQLVWKKSTQIGCSYSACGTGAGGTRYFVICNYYEPGNFGGQFKENVLPPRK